jgi:hypothetical protein
VVGGADGFDALRTGRQAWAAAMKLRDLEAIQQRAEMTEQPSSSIRTQIRTILGNAKKSRGYTDEELAALRDAADHGALGAPCMYSAADWCLMLPACSACHMAARLGRLSRAPSRRVSVVAR